MCGDYDGRMGKLACLNFRGLKEKNNKHSQTVANLPRKTYCVVAVSISFWPGVLGKFA